jgi:hypothetical protein
MDDRKPPINEEDEGSRRATNIGLLIAAIIIVGAGFWLVNALVDANKRELCLESGRRNCAPVSVPDRRTD